MGEAIILFVTFISIVWNTLKCGGIWQMLILSKLKRRKHGFITYDCNFIGFACNISRYRFFIIKSDVLDCNIIIESKIVIFLKHVFPLKYKEILFHEFLVASNKLLMMCKN